MKKYYILLVALLIANGAMAQSDKPCSTCLPEGITFETQDQIDDFQVNYPGCTEIEGNVTITGDGITNLNGLIVITSIRGDLSIGYNSSLTSLTGLEGLISIEGDLTIYLNFALTSLTGLDKLIIIRSDLNILFNNSLTSLTGLEGLTSIGDYLYIEGNSALTSLTGLEGLTSIGYNFSIIGTGALTELTGLNNLTSIGGMLDITSNSALASLTGLNNLTSIGGMLSITSNSALTSLTGLNNLTSIGGMLNLNFNNSLTSLTGLENLTSIGGYLYIEANSALPSLTGLDNIDAGSITGLVLADNSLLSTCDVQSICDYLAAPTGIVAILNNSAGCISDDKVLEACKLGVEEPSVASRQSSVNIYPNPASTTAIIEMHATPNKNTTMTIFYINGQQLLKRQITEQKTVVNVAGIPQGVYFVRVADDRSVMVGKFIKQ